MVSKLGSKIWANFPSFRTGLAFKKDSYVLSETKTDLQSQNKVSKLTEVEKHTHMTKLSSPSGCPLLIGFRPERSSRSTTPNAKTSILSLTLPCMKYSGAK